MRSRISQGWSRCSRACALGVRWAAVPLVLFTFSAGAADVAIREGVLILHSNQRPTPAAVIIEDTLRRVIDGTLGRPVDIYSEYLDSERFTTKAYGETHSEFLVRKYGDRNIRVIVASAAQALPFATDLRSRIPPPVPVVVHLAIPKDQLDAASLAPGIVGVTVDLDPMPTFELAMRLQPHARRLLIILGAGERDRIWESRVRGAVKRLQGNLEVSYLIGLPTPEVLRALRGLDNDTIVYTPGYFLDGTGQIVTPRQAVETITSASAAPVYGPLDTFLGAGIVGGYMAPYADQSAQAGAIAVRLLNGAPISQFAESSATNRPMVDWRQIRRWGLDDGLLPPDTIIRFREPPLWKTHWEIASAVIAAVLLQALMITWLLVERRRRRRAESDSQKRFSEMAHMNRSVAMGGLAASIAHELNQPLGAIHNNAGAAQLLIRADPSKLDEVAEILEDIKHDDKRASEVLSRIRKMLRKTDIEVAALDLTEAIDETLKLLAFDASAHGVSVKSELAPGLAKVWADRIQVQQVILNLALNGMEAMRDRPEAGRQLTIRSSQANAKEAEVSVVDSGPGIPAEILPRIFDPFVTSKSGGMGLGLSISRTIVEAYGGRMRAENLPIGGAGFHFTLPFAAGRRP